MPKLSANHQPKNLPWQARGALSVEHASEVLGTSRKQMYDLISDGKVNVIRISERRMIVPVHEIFRILGDTPRRKTRRPSGVGAPMEALYG